MSVQRCGKTRMANAHLHSQYFNRCGPVGSRQSYRSVSARSRELKVSIVLTCRTRSIAVW